MVLKFYFILYLWKKHGWGIVTGINLAIPVKFSNSENARFCRSFLFANPERSELFGVGKRKRAEAEPIVYLNQANKNPIGIWFQFLCCFVKLDTLYLLHEYEITDTIETRGVKHRTTFNYTLIFADVFKFVKNTARDIILKKIIFVNFWKNNWFIEKIILSNLFFKNPQKVSYFSKNKVGSKNFFNYEQIIARSSRNIGLKYSIF